MAAAQNRAWNLSITPSGSALKYVGVGAEAPRDMQGGESGLAFPV